MRSQTLVTEKTNAIWKYTDGGTYHYFEWTKEASDDKYYTDTIYAIQDFPKKNDWKIYFDAGKSKVATLTHYDTTKRTINTKHFNKQGKLIKELEFKYSSRKKCNPAFIDAKDVIFLKAYRNDSLVYEIQGLGTSLFHKYKNPFTKVHYEKRVYYKDGEHHSDETGESIRTYYENGAIKSICSTYMTVEIDKEGNQMTFENFDCNEFDKNGCIIKDQQKKADIDK